MCSGCQDAAIGYLLDIVDRGVPLEVAEPMYRDSVVQAGLKTDGTDLEDLRAMSKIITDAAEFLRNLRDNMPSSYELAILDRRFVRETSRAD